MKKMEKLTFTGRFTFPSVGEVRGKLTLDGTRSFLHVWSEGNDLAGLWHEEMRRDIGSINGTLDDQNKVSLINCLAQGLEFPTIREKIVIHNGSFFPHYAVLGSQHISHEEETVTEVRFVVEDANVLFHDPEVFGAVTTFGESSIDARQIVGEIVQSKKADLEILVGQYPILLYYTGNNRIFETSVSSSEKISAGREIPCFEAYGTPDGVKIENEVPLILKFDPPVTFNKAVARAFRVFQFLELLIGRSQNLRRLTICMGQEQRLQVYGSGFPNYERHESESKPSFRNVLIKPAQEEQFPSVLKNWLKRDGKCGAARKWFFSYFAKQRLYDEFRIIRAADMFNYLQDIPASEDSRKEIKHCVDVVMKELGNELPDLGKAADQAIVCRNYYVHAEHHKKDRKRIDYDREPNFRIFLTDTLEFVFIVSDLIKSGWDVRTWWKTNSSSSHSIGRYLRHYEENLEKWKHYLSEESTT